MCFLGNKSLDWLFWVTCIGLYKLLLDNAVLMYLISDQTSWKSNQVCQIKNTETPLHVEMLVYPAGCVLR